MDPSGLTVNAGILQGERLGQDRAGAQSPRQEPFLGTNTIMSLFTFGNLSHPQLRDIDTENITFTTICIVPRMKKSI